MSENENNENVEKSGNGEEAAAPANPFAAFTTPVSGPVKQSTAQPQEAVEPQQAAEPQPTAQPQPTASQQAAASQQATEQPAASTQPYYVAPTQPQPAQPFSYGAPAAQTPYGSAASTQAAASAQPAAAQQPYYGAYGSAQQPPVPPATPTPPVQNIYPGYEPPATGQKRRWPWFLLGLFVGIVIGMGGCAGCVGCMALTDYGSSSWNYDDSFGGYDNDYNYTYPHGNDEDTYSWTPEEPYGDGDDYGSSVGVYTYEELVSVLSSMGLEPGTPGEGGQCPKGLYTVGSDGQIPAGLYYLEGSNEKLSHFYVFNEDDAIHGSVVRYEAGVSVQYFGNYYAELDEGDVIAFDPGADVMMHPASPTSTNPTPPYNNGCYRVGVDIPAGSYTITAYPVDEGETDEDSAAYVMDDLEFEEDSIVDTQYVIAGGQQTITVEDGQYLELFAATATPTEQA